MPNVVSLEELKEKKEGLQNQIEQQKAALNQIAGALAMIDQMIQEIENPESEEGEEKAGDEKEDDKEAAKQSNKTGKK